MEWWNRISSLFVEEVQDSGVQQESRGFLQMAGSSVEDIINFFGSNTSKAGQDVNIQSVLGLSSVWRALSILSDSIASLPVHIVQRTSENTTKHAFRHPVTRLLTINPSPLFSPYTLIQTLVTHAALTGNAYAYIHRDRVTSYPKKLTLLDPSRVSLHVLENDRVVYKIAGTNKTVRPYDMIHFGGMSWNGLAGIDVLTYLADNFGLALANQEYLAKFFADGATIAGVIKHPGRLDDGSMLRLRRSWENTHGGSANSGKTAILEQGMDYMPVGLSPQQASAGEVKKLTIADVSRIFGVPQFLLEDLDRATFSNIEHLSLLFIKHTIRPWCKRIEGELNRKLFPVDEQGEFVVKFDIDDIHMVDLENRSKWIETMMKYGLMNRDEIREMQGLNPIEDGSGQKFFVPLNMADPAEPSDSSETNTINEDEQ